jgi:hypothetical protein
LEFWSKVQCSYLRTTVAAISPSVNEEGKGIWSLTSREWYGKELRPSIYGEELLLDGHQMRLSTREDDAGNPFPVVMLCQGTEYKTSYTYLIGKKQNCRFGRLGFSAEEYVRLAYGKDVES